MKKKLISLSVACAIGITLWATLPVGLGAFQRNEAAKASDETESLQPYTFVATDWVTGDEGRISQDNMTYNADNTISMTSEGWNNIALAMSSDAFGKYYVDDSQVFLVVKGSNLSTDGGSSMWWLNGTNKGSSVDPTYAIDATDGDDIIVWNVSKSGIDDNMTGDIIELSGNTIFGLTSTADDYTSVIKDISFYSASEAVAVYPDLAFIADDAYDISVEQTSTGLKATLNGVVTEVRFYSSSIVRVLKYNADDEQALNDKKLTVTMEPQSTSFTYTDDGTTVTVASSDVTVTLGKSRGKLTFYDASGNEMIMEKSGSTQMTATTDGDSDSYTLKQTFTLDDDEAIYGLGQLQNGSLNQRGQYYGYMIQGNCSVWIPYVHSVKGYAIYWDNMSPTTFSDSDSGMYFESSAGHAIDYYYLAGSASDGDATVARMRELTGQVPMIPLWALGYFQSKERYESADETMSVVKKYRDLGIPLDCIVQDWQYWGGNNQWNAMEFLNPNFSNYQEMIDSVHNMNAKIIISFWANFGRDTKQFAHFKENGQLFMCGDTIMTDTYPSYEGVGIYDTYDSDARDYYWQCVYDGLASKGIDAYWMDSSEPDHYQSGEAREKTFDDITGLGCTWRSVRNAYPAVHVGGVYDHHRAESSLGAKRVTILTRSAYAGQQRTGANTWSGDITANWTTLANQIPAALNFTMCGIPNWNSDIGGFFNGDYSGAGQDSYDKLYARWIQFGTFCPMMRSHGAGSDRAIYRFGESGSMYYDNIEKYIRLRYSLLPYIYSTAWNVHQGNASYMRALALAYPQDSNTHDLDTEFLFGQSILVAPVLEPDVTSWSVYLPEGDNWIDFWTGAEQTGGQTVSKTVDLQTLPLYVKAGSIIPWGPDVQYSTEEPWDSLEVRVYPGADGSFTLYEDEFDNYNYESGAYTEIPFTWDDAAQQLTIGARTGSYDGMISTRKFALVLVDENTNSANEAASLISKIVEYDGTAQVIDLNNDNLIENTTSQREAIEEDFRATRDALPLNDATKISFEYGVGDGTYDTATQTVTFNGNYQNWGWGFGSSFDEAYDVTDYKYLIIDIADLSDLALFRLYYYDTDGVLYNTENGSDTDYLNLSPNESQDYATFISSAGDTSYKIKVDLEGLGVARISRACFWNAWENESTTLTISDAYLTNMTTWNVEVTADEFTTVCVPRYMTVLTDGVDFYEPAGVDSKDNPSKLYVNLHEGDLEAGVPYIVKGTASKIYFNLGGDYEATPLSNDPLVGVYDDTEVTDAGAYVLEGGKWTPVTSETVVEGLKAYLLLANATEYSGSDDDVYVLFAEDTGISTVVLSGKGASTGDVYTVSGVKVRSAAGTAITSLPKGVYIVGGKKVVVK